MIFTELKFLMMAQLVHLKILVQNKYRGTGSIPLLSHNDLHFSSDGHLGKGGLDIFYSEKVDGKWTTVKNKGDIVNTTGDDFAYVPYEDGFFVSQFNKNTNSDNTIFIIQTCDDILLETFVLDAKSKLPLNQQVQL